MISEAKTVFKAVSIVVLVLLLAYNFILASYKETRAEGTTAFLMLGTVLLYVCNV